MQNNDPLIPPTAPATQPAGPRPADGGYAQPAATRPAGPNHNPRPQGSGGVAFQQVDPGFLYQVDVYNGTSWGKIGEIWAPNTQDEVWGLYQDWNTYSAGPAALYITSIGNSNTYADLAAFKTAITGQDPNSKPTFWEAKKV